jgi:hypothetical protein
MVLNDFSCAQPFTPLQMQREISAHTDQHIFFEDFEIEKEKPTSTLNRMEERLVE